MLRFLPHAGIDAVTDPRPFDIAFNKADAFQLGEMLRDGRFGQRQLFDDVAADARIFLGEKFENRDACRMRQRLCHIGKTVLAAAEGFLL